MKGYKIVNRTFSTTVWPLLAMAAILCAVAPAKAAEKKPNIVFMPPMTLPLPKVINLFTNLKEGATVFPA